VKTVVLATDFSGEATLAQRHAIQVARHTGAELVLLHVVDVIKPFAPDWLAARPELEGLYKAAKETLDDMRDRLEALRNTLHGQGVKVSKAFIEGRPAESICTAAAEMDADLIAVGTHGRTGLKRMVLGSVAAKVMRQAPTSVFIARGETEPPAGGYRRVLVPTDFTGGTEASLEVALKLTDPEGTLELFHVVAPPFAFTDQERVIQANLDNLKAWADLARKEATRKAEELASRYEGKPRIVTGIVEDYPPQGLIKRLEFSDYDLIVLGV